MPESYIPSFMSSSNIHSTPGTLVSADWIRLMHPDDRSAIEAMESLPGFSSVMQWVLSGVVEKIQYGKNLGDALKLGPEQFPEYYNYLLPVCETLGIVNIPEFYMVITPIPKIWTGGEKRVYICVSSGMLEWFSKEDVQIALAHECGHILFKHVRYLMLAQALLMGMGSSLGKIVSQAAMGGMNIFEQYVYRWVRTADYSADRVALLYSGSFKKGTRMILRMSGGSEKMISRINQTALSQQVEKYEEIFKQNDLDAALRALSLWNRSRPPNASRIAQMKKFAGTTDFKTLSRRLGTLCCPACGASMRTNSICMNGHMI